MKMGYGGHYPDATIEDGVIVDGVENLNGQFEMLALANDLIVPPIQMRYTALQGMA